MPSHASTAAKVRAQKEAHPEDFCADPKCLWRTGGPRGTPCQKHPTVGAFGAPAVAPVEPKRGLRFHHARILSHDYDGITPQLCAVTRVALGVVYYRPVYFHGERETLGAAEYATAERFQVLALSDAEAQRRITAGRLAQERRDREAREDARFARELIDEELRDIPTLTPITARPVDLNHEAWGEEPKS